MHPDCKPLAVGDHVRHLKRGSTYEIVGVVWGCARWKDQERVILAHRAGGCVSGGLFLAQQGDGRLYDLEVTRVSPLTLRLPAVVQISHPGARPDALVEYLIYAPLLGHETLPALTLFVRPRHEFTPDRFSGVAPGK